MGGVAVVGNKAMRDKKLYKIRKSASLQFYPSTYVYKPYPPHAPAYMYIETKEYTKRTIRSQAQLKTKKQIANHEGKIGHTYTHSILHNPLDRHERLNDAYSAGSLTPHYPACTLQTRQHRQTANARNVQFNEPGYESVANHNKSTSTGRNTRQRRYTDGRRLKD